MLHAQPAAAQRPADTPTGDRTPWLRLGQRPAGDRSLPPIDAAMDTVAHSPRR